MIEGLQYIVENIKELQKQYVYDNHHNIYWHQDDIRKDYQSRIQQWLTLEHPVIYAGEQD